MRASILDLQNGLLERETEVRSVDVVMLVGSITEACLTALAPWLPWAG